MRALKYEIFNQDNEKIDEVTSYKKVTEYAEEGMTIKEKLVEIPFLNAEED